MLVFVIANNLLNLLYVTLTILLLSSIFEPYSFACFVCLSVQYLINLTAKYFFGTLYLLSIEELEYWLILLAQYASISFSSEIPLSSCVIARYLKRLLRLEGSMFRCITFNNIEQFRRLIHKFLKIANMNDNSYWILLNRW